VVFVVYFVDDCSIFMKGTLIWLVTCYLRRTPKTHTHTHIAQKVIAYMTLGIDVSSICSEIVMVRNVGVYM